MRPLDATRMTTLLGLVLAAVACNEIDPVPTPGNLNDGRGGEATGSGGTPAMRGIGLRSVDAAGHPPGWRRGLKRTAASWLSAAALGLGYLAAAWHPEKRTWHDRIAGTWVVDVRDQR